MNKDEIRFLSVLTNQMKINVSARDINEEIKKHVDFPSVSSVIKILTNWNIEATIYTIDFGELDIISGPFLTYINNAFTLVFFKDEKIIIYNKFFYEKEISRSEFEKGFNQVIVSVIKRPDPENLSFHHNRKNQTIYKQGFLFLTLSLFCIYMIYFSKYLESINGKAAIIIAVKLLGLTISLLLFRYTIDADSENNFLRKICRQNNCDKILSSKASYLIKGVSWSEVGILYFSITASILMIDGQNTEIFQLISFINIFSLFFSIYSIYYQWKIAKNWCMMCCFIQIILWTEFILFYFIVRNNITVNFSSFSLLKTFLSITLSIIAWIWLKPFILNIETIKKINIGLSRFKYDPIVFWALLNSSPKFDLPDDYNTITWGSETYNYLITIVLDPSCKPCSDVYKLVKKLSAIRENFKFQLVFSFPQNTNTATVKLVKHLILLNKQSEILFEGAYCEWGASKGVNYEKWAKKYPVSIEEDISDILQNQYEWCKTSTIDFSPTILINGRKLSLYYSVEDLKYFLI